MRDPNFKWSGLALHLAGAFLAAFATTYAAGGATRVCVAAGLASAAGAMKAFTADPKGAKQ